MQNEQPASQRLQQEHILKVFNSSDSISSTGSYLFLWLKHCALFSPQHPSCQQSVSKQDSINLYLILQHIQGWPSLFLPQEMKENILRQEDEGQSMTKIEDKMKPQMSWAAGPVEEQWCAAIKKQQPLFSSSCTSKEPPQP